MDTVAAEPAMPVAVASNPPRAAAVNAARAISPHDVPASCVWVRTEGGINRTSGRGGQVHDSPDQELPDHDDPDHDEPDQELPDQVDPDQVEPFHTPPVQALPAASA